MNDSVDGGANALDILLVEDEPVILMVASDMLSDAGYRVRECGSAEEALGAIGDGYRPHLVIADHGLPGMNGLDFAERLQDGGDAPAVLIASGDTSGANGRFPVLAKPYRDTELLAAVADLIGQSGTAAS